ncbi:MAG: hypothetical protein ACI854_002208, partial [Arenicella sp.]
QGLDELYCDVFDGLPRILWQIFENPSEIETNLPRA